MQGDNFFMDTKNFVVRQGEKFGRSILMTKPPKIRSLKGLKYAPEKVFADVIEISQKSNTGEKKITKELIESMINKGKRRAEIARDFNVNPTSVIYFLKKYGLFKPTRKARSLTPINKEELQKLANEGLSLNKMASELNTTTGRVRLHLDRYNIATDAQEEFRVLKDYFSATTQEAKLKAFEKVDKYLQEIARERAGLKTGNSYEDCLQDVRLSFFELEKKNKEQGTDCPSSILRCIRNEKTPKINKINTIKIEHLKDSNPNIKTFDSEIERFETKDYDKNLKQRLRYFFKEREFVILFEYLEKGKTIEELANMYSLTTNRIKGILNEALYKARDILENSSLTGNL